MKKFFSLFAAVLFAASMMAEEAVLQYTGGVTTNLEGEGVNNAATLGLDEDLFTVLADKGSNQNFPGLNQANDIRLYADKNSGNGNIIIVSIASGTITSIVLDIKQTATFVVKAGETAVTEAGGAYAINAASFSIQNTTTGATTQLRLNKITITYETGDVPQTMSYYVAGSMNNWSANASYKLKKNPAVEGEYMGDFTFAAGDELKVVYSDGLTIADENWFPTGMGNNFVISEDGDYTIYFRPDGQGGADWHEGFIYAVLHVTPRYEVAEAIAAGLTDDTEIEVRGIVTKMQIKGKNFANYGTACIYVKDATGAEGEFEFYNCYSFEGAKFTSTIPAYDATSTDWADLTKLADANGNEIRLGDTIVAFGKYKLFNSTYELNTGCNIVDIKSAPVAPAQGINVNMSEGLFYDDHVADAGWWQLYGEDEHFVISVSNVETTQAEGTYTIADLDADWTYLGIIDGTDTTYVSFVDGSVNLSISAEGDVTVAGTLVGDDGNNYILNLVFVSPKPTVTVDVNIQNAELIDYYADYGLYGVYGTDANDIYVQFAIWTETFEGEFTEKDLDFQYIGSGIFEGEEQVNIYTAAITVTPGNGGDYNITATVVGYNNKQYNVTMYVPAGETAIENVDAVVKAIKSLVNGNLLIEKGNKTYNANGARIR